MVWRRFKIIACGGLAVGAVLTAYLTFAPKRPESCPVRVSVSEAAATSTSNARSGGSGPRFGRRISIHLDYPESSGVDLVRLGEAEVKVGDRWEPQPMSNAVPDTTFALLRSAWDTHTLTVPTDAETLRLTFCYWKSSAWLPLGIGDFRARQQPANTFGGRAQGAVRAVSTNLNSWLWPRVPTGARSGWRTNTVELQLPKHYPRMTLRGDDRAHFQPEFGAPLDR